MSDSVATASDDQGQTSGGAVKGAALALLLKINRKSSRRWRRYGFTQVKESAAPKRVTYSVQVGWSRESGGADEQTPGGGESTMRGRESEEGVGKNDRGMNEGGKAEGERGTGRGCKRLGARRRRERGTSMRMHQLEEKEVRDCG